MVYFCEARMVLRRGDTSFLIRIDDDAMNMRTSIHIYYILYQIYRN